MPPGGAEARAELVGALQGACHERLTAPPFRRALGALCELRTGAAREGLSPRDAALARETWRRWNRARRLPASLVTETARLQSASQQAWVEARRRSDFERLRPYLERLVALKRETSGRLGGEHPYDPLLDEFEPGMTVRELDPLLGALRRPLKDLARRAAGRGRPSKALDAAGADGAALEGFCRDLAGAMGFDFSRGLLARSAHPFSTGLHPSDVRFTLRAEGDGPLKQVLTALHECGHSLYEQGLDPAWWGTPLGEWASLGLHEAMSRLWENLVGRDPALWAALLPRLKKALPALAKVGARELQGELRVVRMVPVRLESDEVTYSLHILLRYELEKDLVTGRLRVKDVPEAWNAKSRELLGVVPPDDRRGCLQDVHWAAGLIGYFPTYALGNIFGAQLFAEFRRRHPRWEKDVSALRLAPLKAWLDANVHRHGRRWRAAELVRRVTGKPVSASYFLEHLEARYA